MPELLEKTEESGTQSPSPVSPLTAGLDTVPPPERLENPSRKDFEKVFVEKNQPVILTGIAEKWRAMDKWSPDYFRKIAGNSEVTVHFHERCDFHDWYTKPKGRVDKTMTLGEYMELGLSENPDYRYYMTEHALRFITPKLVSDVDVSRYVPRTEPLLFMGRDATMPMHYHGTTEAILCQLQNPKLITLFPPDQTRYLYPRAFWGHAPYFSKADFKNDRPEDWPDIRKARKMEFVLNPGEILFIPVHWWHWTRIEDHQLSVSVTCFWKSDRSRWTWPQPGWSVVGRHIVRWPGETARRAGRKLLGRESMAPQDVGERKVKALEGYI